MPTLEDLQQVHPEVHASFVQLLAMEPQAIAALDLRFEVCTVLAPASSCIPLVICSSTSVWLAMFSIQAMHVRRLICSDARSSRSCCILLSMP